MKTLSYDRGNDMPWSVKAVGGDRIMQKSRNDDKQVKIKSKTVPVPLLSTANLAWSHPGLNLSLQVKKTAYRRLNTAPDKAVSQNLYI